MRQDVADFGLCLIITKPRLSYKAFAKVAVECGVKYLQLREKDLSDREILSAAEEILSITRGSATKFIINDRADLALLSGADMLHLGQGDITLADARRIVGDEMPIGLSTHSLEQAREAIAQSPAYIGFGPIYPTTTKVIADPTVGADMLREVMSFAPIPVIAIGGIFPHNAAIVIGSGARNICLVRHFMECESEDELAARITELQSFL